MTRKPRSKPKTPEQIAAEKAPVVLVKKTPEKPIRVGDGTPGPGRPKGVPNKTTTAVKEMILAALDMAGGADYLLAQSSANPTAFMTLVGKVLPLDVNNNHGVQDSLADLMRAIDGRSKGLPGK